MLFQVIVISILLIMSNSDLGISVDLSFGNTHEQKQKKNSKLLFKQYKMRILMPRIILRLFHMKLKLNIAF